MKYFLDTEFQDDGKTLDLISIGIVTENGINFYAENMEFNWFTASEWLIKNVKPSLFSKNISEGNTFSKLPCNVGGFWSRQEIANNILSFIGADPRPEFWGFYSAYDWVIFCQLFGPMIDLPKPLPYRCNDLKQLMNYTGIEIKQPVEHTHHALLDAQWIKKTYNEIQNELYKKINKL